MSNRQMLEERGVIIGITSTAVRLIGLAIRDHQENLIDEAAAGLEKAIDGLEAFGGIAGCDSTPYTTIALRQIVIWMRARDEPAARKAFDERYQTSDEQFCASMERAWEEVRSTLGEPE